MKSSELSRALAICITTRQPVIVWGEPGGGKTSVANLVIKAMGRNPIDFRAATADVVDQRGLPMIDKQGRTNWALPSYLPTEPNQVILYDDFPQASVAVMNGLSELILDRTQNGKENYTLPEDTAIIATGNRKKDRAGTNEMPTHLRNRFVHLDFETDVDDWAKWAMNTAAIPTFNLPAYEETTSMDPMIIAFHRFRPTLLHKFESTAYAFASPRSVSFVNKLLPYLKLPAMEDIQFNMIAGCCGEGYATEFTGFLRLVTRMPNPDVVFRDPDNAPIPEEPGIMYALCSTLAARVQPKKTADAMFRYIGRIAQDMAVTCAMDSVNRDVKILQCTEGMKWAAKNAPFMIG